MALLSKKVTEQKISNKSLIKTMLDKIMIRIKKENPDATWSNLLTGLGILLLVAVFSISYFGRTPGDTTVLGDSEEATSSLTEDSKVEDLGIFTTDLNKKTVIVEKGEGLWHVAKRACGNGELYNYLAKANGLNIWSSVYVGQELVLDCGPINSSQNN